MALDDLQVTDRLQTFNDAMIINHAKIHYRPDHQRTIARHGHVVQQLRRSTTEARDLETACSTPWLGAVLFAMTFCSFLREFSSLEMYAGKTKKAMLGWCYAWRRFESPFTWRGWSSNKLPTSPGAAGTVAKT